MHFDDLIRKVQETDSLTKEELVLMLSYPADSPEAYRIMAAANMISKELTGNKAEVHAQFALNLAPCPANCAFCSFAKMHGIFTQELRITAEDAVAQAKRFEAEGANAIFVMTTAAYPFGLFLDMSSEIRRNLNEKTLLIANVGDQSLKNAIRLKEAGYTGVYHALRLREGTDTTLSPEGRRQSIRNFQEAGLGVGTCIEPVGPEHTNEEIAELIQFTSSISPSYSGAARRITIPGSEIAKRGMISELRMAQVVAVTRLGVTRKVLGNCTHEPCTLGAIAGANLFWAESGANPRDTRERTEEGRGESVSGCRALFRESGWEVWEGPSRYYTGQG